MTPEAVVAAVDRHFAVTSVGMSSWPNPHPDRSPLDEEYSRLTKPERYRILGARAEAWLLAVEELDLADVERAVSIEWVSEPGPVISRVDRATSRLSGTVPLFIAHSRLGDIDDSGVTIGIGDPTHCVAWLPQCGCDACDDGSQYELDRLDEILLGIVTGTFRHLTKGDETITVTDGQDWSASGWIETSGRSWLAG